MARDPARRPPPPLVGASNAALVTGILLIVIGLFTAVFLVVVGVFLIAVAIGLALANRRGRNARQAPPTP